MVKSADQQIPSEEPEPIVPPDIGELSPEEEREWERLDRQGGAGGNTAEMARSKASGGRIAMEGEAQLRLIDSDTDEAEAAQHRRRRPLPSARRQKARGPKIGKRPQAWGEKAPSDDGLTALDN